ncbi:MAG: S1C family serine protease [Planctomycetota bacterium]
MDVETALRAERQRVETIARVTPACVCIYDSQRRGGGSAVIIDPAGYGLTNFHVVAQMLESRRGLAGLPDGRLYDLEVLGIDPTGDVAMFRLLGKDRFDYAQLGDSEAVSVGDFVLAMGNPFVLSEDHTPTVTMGIVTGVHRYQWGRGNTLVYSDCIQTDAAINPGNSGGPLLDMQGRVIGINGRISLAAGVRGQVNVGVGYAISVNQIRRFLPGLRAGLLLRHGTLQATVDRACMFNDMLEDGPAWNAGIRPGDRLVRFGDRNVVSDNQLASMLGTYPENWPVPISFEQNGRIAHGAVRLEALPIRRGGAFTVDPAVNHGALDRVVRRFRESVAPRPGTPGPGSWRWESRRTALTSNGQDTDRPQKWMHTFVAGGDSVHRQLDEAGETVRTIVCDEDGARLTAGEARYALALSERLPLIALHALRGLVLTSAEGLSAESWSHVGGDEWLLMDDAGRVIEAGLLEVIEQRRADGATLRYGFSADTGLVRRIVARDEPSGVEAVIGLTDYREFGHLRWPMRLEVRCGAIAYAEERGGYEAGE